MQNTQQLQYLKVQVETASPGELTLMLYQEIVKSLLKAKQFYAWKQYEEMNTVLHKVRSIFNELIITLNFKYEISEDLRDLYLFYNAHIARFIVSKDEVLLDETLEFARLMVDTWKQALMTLKTGKGN
ncbi:flagellar export chaperone FliS [Paenibacillus sp. FSL K6-2441]|uniref:flagellar export chaperone FliS n=1 Tax=Paenibacillus TaxID=44249 RepID=UPI0030DAE029